MGGPSAEREVSLNTGKNVLRALQEREIDAVAIDWTPEENLVRLILQARVDTIWNALHGTYGEDGAVQGLLECLRIPYTGSGVRASAVGMDKVLSKLLFREAGIASPEFRIVRSEADAAAAAREWGYPVVTKPSREGSSVGVTIVRAPAQLPAALAEARRFHGETLIERYVPGREINVGVLDGEALGSVEIRPAKDFYDYEAKYLRSDTQYLCPAPVEPAVEQALRDAALRAYRAIGCAGHARVDFIVDAAGTPCCLEVNTLPGMTGTSLLPKIARAAGIDYAELVVRILRTAALRA